MSFLPITNLKISPIITREYFMNNSFVSITLKYLSLKIAVQ